MDNEESFRNYALWTFAISSLHCIIYLGIFLASQRTIFFVNLAVIITAAFAYWFRDGGVKQGWDGLSDSIFITLGLGVVCFIVMVAAGVLGAKMLNKFEPNELKTARNIILYIYHMSPLVVTLINIVNFVIFIARN